MKKIQIAFLLLSSLTVSSQSIEINGGLNINRFYDFASRESRVLSNYQSENGYSIRLGYENRFSDRVKLRFTLGYIEYGGQLYTESGGLGSKSIVNAEVRRSVISLGVFPLNFKLKNRINLNFGVELSSLINDKINVIYSTTPTMTEPAQEHDLNDMYDDLSQKFYLGLRGRIAYDFVLSDQWSILPQYSYYLGMTNEFIEFQAPTKSMRHNFCIGVQRKF